MPSPADLWNEELAYDGLKKWLEAVFGAPGAESWQVALSGDSVPFGQIHRWNQNVPRGKVPAIYFRATTADPVTEGFQYDQKDTAQQQLWNSQIVSAAPGPYTLTVLTQPATYVAGGGDTVTTIRDGLRAAVDLLGLPVTTGDIGADTFSILGDTAGTSLGVVVDAGDIALTVINDNIRRCRARRAFWTVRFLCDDIKPDSDTVPSAARQRAKRIQTYMEAGDSLPLVSGNAVTYLNDLLAPGAIAYNVTVAQLPDLSFQQSGLWVVRAAADVRFTTRTGLAFDVPSLDTLGAQPPQIMEA